MKTQTQGGSTRRYRSPNRILARFFRRSRDRWKQKYQELQEEMKRLKNRVADMGRSREAWREKAEKERAARERLEGELAAWQEKAASQEAEKKGVC